MNSLEEMFISTWKCPCLIDNLASMSSEAILSATITEDFLTGIPVRQSGLCLIY